MKRSLHIGINEYPDTGSDLSGCVNDANDWRLELEARGFVAESLLDGEAKKGAMVEAISKIVADTGRDDIAVITYSGHGTWVPDKDGDEVDKRDEALCPNDIAKGEVLVDDELYEIFSNRKWGARVIF
ncbi:MAG TPA: caspase family protein, partial [Nitratifractor sp.]|nr:caspase family protein [Nitratifractor sp.]